MYNRISGYTSNLFKNAIFSNSFWGIIAQVSQSLFLSLFFVIIARQYSMHDFANYVIVNVLFQLVTAFSSLGLSQWFIREMAITQNAEELQAKFFKIQLYLGIIFYVVNVGGAYLFYADPNIRMLALLLGVNLIFDNLINAIKGVNIALNEQKKTFIILSIESVLKFLVGCALFIYPFSIITLTVVLIAIRFISLNAFLSFGSSNIISLQKILRYKLVVKDIFQLVFSNWAFIIISGASIINWRISTIIISKVLTTVDVANYEICYKLFSIAQILPVIISSSVFPPLITAFNNGDKEKFNQLYRKMHLYYMLFGLFSYTFIYAFADYLLPFAFGKTYAGAGPFAKQMFLTILVFPTVLLQATVLMAAKKEKLDMLFNVVSLAINLAFCAVGLYFFKSLLVINLAVFASFITFHVLQDFALVKNKISTGKQALEFYLISAVIVAGFISLSTLLNPPITFLICWAMVGVCFAVINRQKKMRLNMLLNN